jgi:hypothetical protein
MVAWSRTVVFAEEEALRHEHLFPRRQLSDLFFALVAH